MNKLIKLVGTAILSTLISTQAFAFDHFITIKFKKNVSEKYIQTLNKMTSTSTNKIISRNNYRFLIDRVANNDTLDRYSELFSVMSMVQSVSPMPKQKMADKINSNYYVNTSTNEKEDITQKTPDPTKETKLIPDQIMVKFNSDSPKEDIDLLNQSLGGDVSYQKDTDSYKVKIPDYMDFEYAKNFYGNNRLVEKVDEVTETTTNTPQTTDNSNKKTYTQNKSGVSTTVPVLESSELKVTFKIGEEEDGLQWLTESFQASVVEKNGNSTFIFRFPAKLNVKALARGLKVCTVVSNAEVIYE